MPAPQAAPLRSAPPPVRQPDNMRGIVLMALGFFAFAACDVQAKVLTETLHPVQIVWLRLLGLFLGVVVMIAMRGTHLLRTKNPVLQISRGLAAVASAVCFLFAVRDVPLADATAVSFIAPFVVTVVGALVLKETVGIRRWIAVAIGFAGMLVVIRPGLGVFHPAIFFVVLAACLFASRQILSRFLAGGDPVATTVAYTSITATLVASLLQPFFWETPQGWGVWAVIFGMTVCSALGEVLVIRALDMAQAVVLAPLHYSLIIWSTLYGFLVFGDLPDGWTLFGCAVIVASGLYTLHRERLAMAQSSSE
ncbi:DMT family transporter [Tropicibacter naphthalenivorans]|uniref:Carboxylate/amino acid/amine transporter n=1 Tax=Tropicibacter naphthalenivorans TaxID=441103 RepID=A0A0P1GTA9_9RHOB|nr:DMT family transporter [Tropicibacter naphthalenivorans]CUH78660.1 carboxylate/amino acid/amine transporter [Tropicibacter naphthalenivorans]SMC81153.1 S-adenosylmethionine uptake transporter [Tropicibacter naphthalenivorans]